MVFGATTGVHVGCVGALNGFVVQALFQIVLFCPGGADYLEVLLFLVLKMFGRLTGRWCFKWIVSGL